MHAVHRRFPWALLLLSFVAAADAHAAEPALRTYQFNPVADTSIYADVSGVNLTWDNVSDGLGESLWLSTTAGGVLRRSLMRFDLSTIPAGEQVVSASLGLFQLRSRDSHDVSVHRMLASWGEGSSNGGSAGVGSAATAGDATWRWRDYLVSEWAQRGGDFAAQSSATTLVAGTNTSYTWASTAGLVADVQGWLDNPASSFGWIFLGPEIDAQNAKRFDSRQGLIASQRPLLVVQTVPIPEASTLAMFAVGLAALLLLRRRSASTQKSGVAGLAHKGPGELSLR